MNFVFHVHKSNMRSNQQEEMWSILDDKIIEERYYGYSMKGRRILLQKIDKAQKHNELIELHSHMIIDITSLKQIINLFLSTINL